MRKLLVLCLLVLNAIPVTRSSEPLGTSTIPKDFAQYHQEILKIDSLNAALQFDLALLKYFDLFSAYRRVMVKDAYNACQIAAYTSHPKFIDFFLLCGATGLPLNTILRNKQVFLRYQTDSLELKKQYLEKRILYLKRIDLTLQVEMQERYQKEQQAKGSTEYPSVCQENFSRILELSKQNRFPGEALIGTNDDLENVVVPTLCHYPYAYKQMEQYLNQAVLEGSLPPMLAMYVYGFSQTRTSVLYTEAIPVDTAAFNLCYNLPFGKQSNDIIRVDQNRAIKWIPSVSIQKQIKSELPKRGIDYQFGF